MKKILVAVLSVVIVSVLAQQEQQFTQYMINPYTINPALGGTEDFTDVKMGYRKQWVNIESAPRTFYVTGHTTVGKEFNAKGYHHKTEHKQWHGVGGYVYGDRTGAIKRNSFYGQYSYNMPISAHTRLSVGSFFGLKQYSYDLNGLKREDKIDNAIPFDGVNLIVPDMSLGFWFYSKDWYIGGSMSQLLQNDINVYSSENTESAQLAFHSFITGGVRLSFTEHVHMVPSIAVKASKETSPSVDLNVKVDFDDEYFGGVSYRSGDSFALLVGTVVNNKLELSYSYDITVSSINKVSNGSHEVIIGMRLVHPNRMLCPSQFW